VLVTSFNPLKVYIYNDGLVRFATERYSNDPKLLTKKYVHLTNFSVNKRAPNFVKNNDKRKKAMDSDNEDESGISSSSKQDFRQLKQAYEKIGVNFAFIQA